MEDGRTTVIRRRQTIDDLLALEVTWCRRRATTGSLIAFEGLDQSGKQTQAESLRDHLTARGRVCRLLSFPDYETPIGAEISQGAARRARVRADVMQLLYVANRYEKRGTSSSGSPRASILICDRYLASSIAYGEAQGLDAGVARPTSSGSFRSRTSRSCSTSRRRRPSGARPPIAIATSATWRCCRACARAIAGRPRRTAGSASTASAAADVAADVITAVETRLALP